MQDFPAAHSMDTDWFAVDADGHIGFFDSWENGAVPESNSTFSDMDDFLKQWSRESGDGLIRLNIPAKQILTSLGIDPQDSNTMRETIKNRSPQILSSLRFTQWIYPDDEITISRFTHWLDRDEISNPETYKSLDEFYRWLLLADGNEAEIFEIIKNNCFTNQNNQDSVVSFFGKPVLMVVSELPLTTVEILFTNDYLQFALPLYDNDFFATLLGLFSYVDDSCWYPFPYECEIQPICPLKLSDLPETLQDAVIQNRFEKIKFSRSPKIQPIEHMPCRTWGDQKWWLDTQGNVIEEHPF